MTESEKKGELCEDLRREKCDIVITRRVACLGGEIGGLLGSSMGLPRSKL